MHDYATVLAEGNWCREVELKFSEKICPVAVESGHFMPDMPPSDLSDPQLLAQWSDHRCEAAFRELVARYAGLVHAAARRTGGEETLAAEAAQATFILLARKAASLVTRPSLAGWLHQTAILQTRNLLRQSRREDRKRQALQTAMETPNPTHDDTWQELQPVLDDALAALSAADREALLLRFYRSLSMKEIATTLGIATDAAQKRVDRATDRLRGKLIRRGCQTGGSLSAVMLAGFASDAQAAAFAVPLFTAKAIAAGAVSSGTISTITAFLTATAMKTTSAVVPLVVLLAVGAWLAGQFQSIAELEHQNARLQKNLADAERPAAVSNPPAAIKTALDRSPIDWAEVARLLYQGQSEQDGLLQSTARLTVQLRAMSRDELVTALDEIAAATIPQDHRELLERFLCEDLVGPKGGPRLVLDRFTRRMSEGTWPWTLAVYFKDWIDKDPDEAIAWLRQRSAEMGNPDQLVSLSFYPRLASDPATASRILTALPESKRLEALRTLEAGSLADPNRQVAWAGICRTDLPAKDRMEAIVWPAGNWSDGDGSRMSMADVAAYMDRIQATPAEREACVLNAAAELAEHGTFDDNDSLAPTEKIEALRAWVRAQAPQSLDRATGKGLASLGRGGGEFYAEAAKLALSYHDASPHDELLIPLLENDLGDEHKATARALAERLSNAALRRRFLDILQ